MKKQFLLTTSALLFLSAVPAIATELSHEEQTQNPRNSVVPLQDAFGIVAKNLKKNNLLTLRETSQSTREDVDSYSVQQHMNAVNTILNKPISIEDLRKERDFIATPGIVDVLLEKLEKRSWGDVFFVDSYSWLNETLQTIEGEGKIAHRSIRGLDLYKENKELFKSVLFGDVAEREDEPLYQDTAIQHLISNLTFHTKKDTLDEEDLQGLLKIKESTNYLNFTDLETIDVETLRTTAAHIVITDTDLVNPENKQRLVALLEQNPEHTLVLGVGDAFVNDNGILNMSARELPANLRHLSLVDPEKKVLSIGNFFLDYATSLTSFDARGFENVKEIGYKFLYGATSLTSFDARGFEKVTEIGSSFLYGATSLTSFDARGFEKVTEIGYKFLYGATSLNALIIGVHQTDLFSRFDELPINTVEDQKQ